MLTDSHMLTLAQWLSPAYPVGAFSYSHGLEWAEHIGDVSDAASFQHWLSDILQHGTGRNDAILLSHAYHADRDNLTKIDTLSRAFAASKERLLETEAQGAAFVKTTAAIWGEDLPALTYPVALGHAAACQGIAAMRLVPLGQTEGQRVLHALTPLCQQLAEEAATLPLDALGGSCVLADIASMKHETQYTRLFRS